MEKEKFTVVAAEDAPKAIGPYSQAIIANGFVYTSGQIGLDPATGLLRDGLEALLDVCLVLPVRILDHIVLV